MYPGLQAHLNDPAVFVHVASIWQLWVLSWHSSLSDKLKRIWNYKNHVLSLHRNQIIQCHKAYKNATFSDSIKNTTEKTFTKDLPVHVTPLPLNPVLQAQVNDPSVLVHVALLSQLWVPRVHSLLSVKW